MDLKTNKMKKKNELNDYVINHLSEYIKYHIERGYSEKSVKEALLKFGYSNKLLDSIIKNTKIIHKIIDKPYSQKDLEGETYYYLRGIIIEYIKKQQNHGFNKEEIRKALIKYGHSKEIVNDAFILMKGRKEIKFTKKTMFWINITLILFFTIILALLLDVKLVYTLIIFSPSVLGFILSKIALDYFKKIKKHIPLISVILTIILFFSIFPALNKTDADSDVILGLNAILAFITTYFYTIAEDKREEKK
jgi:hypothetical protein